MSSFIGLAHVATASFLASRIAPGGGFAIALAGGVALARVAERAGLRMAWGASTAAMLQTIAIMGPARVGVPLTQAISAPVLGRMEARGRSLGAQAVVAAMVRLAHNALGTWLYVWLILGIDAYTGTYDRLLGWLPILPEGRAGALAATLLSLAFWTVGASVVQALVYRRGLRRWPAAWDAAAASRRRRERAVMRRSGGRYGRRRSGVAHRSGRSARAGRARRAPAGLPVATVPAVHPRFDPRAVLVAAIVAFGLLVASTAWPLLAAVALWLAVAWAFARGDTRVVRPGLALTALLAGGALIAGLVGGLALEVTLRRTVRAALLVLVATWLRSASSEDGLREVFRRMLRRTRRIPLARETSEVLEGLGSTDALTASGRRLIVQLDDVPGKPLPVADAVLGWVADEAQLHPTAHPGRAPRALRARPSDGLLVALAAATALTLPLAT